MVLSLGLVGGQPLASPGYQPKCRTEYQTTYKVTEYQQKKYRTEYQTTYKVTEYQTTYKVTEYKQKKYRTEYQTTYKVKNRMGGEGFIRRSKKKHLPKIWIFKKF